MGGLLCKVSSMDDLWSMMNTNELGRILWNFSFYDLHLSRFSLFWVNGGRGKKFCCSVYHAVPIVPKPENTDFPLINHMTMTTTTMLMMTLRSMINDYHGHWPTLITEDKRDGINLVIMVAEKSWMTTHIFDMVWIATAGKPWQWQWCVIPANWFKSIDCTVRARSGTIHAIDWGGQHYFLCSNAVFEWTICQVMGNG